MLNCAGEGVVQGLNKQVNICHPVSEAGVYVKKGAMSSATTVLSQEQSNVRIQRAVFD